MSRLTRRAIGLAKLESVYNTDALPSAATDGILVETPDFMADMTILARDFTRGELSMLPHTVERKLAKISFTRRWCIEARRRGYVLRHCRQGRVFIAQCRSSTTPLAGITSREPSIARAIGRPMRPG